MRTSDEEIFDEAMERGALLLRVQAGLAADVLRAWRPFRQRLVAVTESALSRIATRGDRTLDLRSFEELLRRQERVINRGFGAVRKLFTPALEDLAVREGRWVIETLSSATPNFDFEELPKDTLRRIARTRPMQGRHLREWYQTLRVDTKQAVREAVRQGVQQGQTVRAIVGRLTSRTGGVLNASSRHLETMVHTAVQSTSAQVRKTVYAEHKDAIESEYWSAALDTRTCPACASLDSREWPHAKGPYPPAHPRCRCARLPRIKGAAAGERASRDGPVPGDTTFSQWLERQSVDQQNAILGKGRAELFRAGKLGDLDPAIMLDANNRPLPLKDLLTKMERQNT